MTPLTEEQIESVYKWMKSYSFAPGFSHIEFKNEFMGRLNRQSTPCSHENIGDDWGHAYCLDCGEEVPPKK